MISTTLTGSDSWGLAEESDRRFRRICARVGVPVLILALILPWITWKLQEPPPEVQQPVQYAELLPEPQKPASSGEEPAPAKQSEKAQAPAPAATRPAEKQPAAPSKTSREIAEQSGLLQYRDQLADMRSENPDMVTGQQQLVSSTSIKGENGGASAAAIAASAATGSGGIGGAGSASVTNAQNGSGLGTRQTGDVHGRMGSGHGEQGTDRGDEGGIAGRSLEEIQITFDRSKSAFFSIFNRATREDAGVGAGKISVNLTIAPDGSVTRCEIVSSSFNNPELEQKILLRVKMLNFGAKKVPPFTFPNYPINFIPS